MGSGIFGATEGAKVQSAYLDVIANNLANAQTVGFKADKLEFGEYLFQAEFKDYGGPILEKEQRPRYANCDGTEQAFVKITGQRIDMGQGNLRQTGNVLDVAIDGAGFFQVRLEDGQTFFTRDGRLRMGADGELQHSSGGQILDESGQPIRIGGQGPIAIEPDGTIFQGKAEQGKLAVYKLPVESAIGKAGHTLFSYDRPEAPPELNDDARIQQGFIEGSNVNPIAEMTRMIQVNRHFEYMNKLIKAYNDTDMRSIADVGRTQQ
jgi:flagellar basal-body rod protein FlgF